MMKPDSDLLHDYCRERSHPAFAELVSRHIDWVYSAALRMVNDHSLAQDVTQAVFLLLWQQPRKAIGRPLPGWLFRVARYCVADARRSEKRRQKHERQAARMKPELVNPGIEGWSEFAPLLDDLMARLHAHDRELLLLRFYQQKKLAEIGAAFNISEDAARKQVDRAVEKLRALFVRQGVTTTTMGLGILMGANTTHAAPAALAASLSAATPAASPAAIGFSHGAAKMILMAKLKIAAIVLLSVGFIPAAVATIHLASQYAIADGPSPLAQSVVPSIAAPPPGIPIQQPNAIEQPDAPDQQLARFLNSHTDMVFAIDPLVMDWDTIDSTRDKMLHDKGIDPNTIDHSPIVPTFAPQNTAIYRRWTADFKAAGGNRIYVVSQAGTKDCGAFDVGIFDDSTDPITMTDIFTPQSWSTQHYFQAGIIDHMVAAANHRMVTALSQTKPEPRPDLMEALAASNMPIREIWVPSQCRLAGRPTISSSSIDGGSNEYFRGAQWDNTKWIVTGLTLPPNDAMETIIQCRDAQSAQLLAKWLVATIELQKHRSPLPSEFDIRAGKKVNVENDQIHVDCDPTLVEKFSFTNNPSPFNIMP